MMIKMIPQQKELKSGILNPRGYLNLSTKVGYGRINFRNFGLFFKAESIIFWTSTMSMDVVSIFQPNLAELVLGSPYIFSRSVILAQVSSTSTCTGGNLFPPNGALFKKRWCLGWLMGSFSWALLSRISSNLLFTKLFSSTASSMVFTSWQKNCLNWCSSIHRWNKDLDGTPKISSSSSSQSSTKLSITPYFATLVI